LRKFRGETLLKVDTDMEDFTFNATESKKIASHNAKIAAKGLALLKEQMSAAMTYNGLIAKHELKDGGALDVINAALDSQGVEADARWIKSKGQLSKMLKVARAFDDADAIIAAGHDTMNAAYESLTTVRTAETRKGKLVDRVTKDVAAGNVGARDAATIADLMWDAMSAKAQAAFLAARS